MGPACTEITSECYTASQVAVQSEITMAPYYTPVTTIPFSEMSTHHYGSLVPVQKKKKRTVFTIHNYHATLQ